ncbi:MAG: hypothetical protein D4R64_04940 [Porphyromonadaceae bacterium]|nr:MAG: hypothetical protein D4R64_04940 [Porphyromonadaceae bacterium]
MMAAELYKKTLASYEAFLSKGESVSLSRYCKIHHVNYRGLGYWMKKQSLDIPKNKLGKEARHSDSNHTDQLVTGPHHMVPLLIQSPIRDETSRLRKSSLKGVNITIQNGLVVCINEISCVDL